jgi:hypothetical protein
MAGAFFPQKSIGFAISERSIKNDSGCRRDIVKRAT